ncbi:hypothetical protein NAEGRDRAFT_80737 [Naegleria gruberi]|uniref:Uncharacterized protein n=1 Tax=Naegleria gruberi TaxID=5762 RepID=D2VPC4_NAEGR|nr:uncharacterized protein NAEGRDRAFT_80737 [Naegleria gruberi]EFC41332.1 hypothetical protein NAEGRDRAFT_80737 [Naegleria gruberi]|eukprot:XP_002674076.1 hypothetical protein NAEGRDRAFT_80737 [Naegleria gruberi strain NEG-M]
MISQEDYSREMNRRTAMAEFSRRVNGLSSTATQCTIQTSTKTSEVSGSSIGPSPDHGLSNIRAPRINKSPTRIVKQARKSKIAEQALRKIVLAYLESNFMTKSKTEFQKETRSNFQKHILIGFILQGKNYLGAYEYFRSFFTVDQRSIFTREDIHDIRTVSTFLLGAHFCSCVANKNKGELKTCNELISELLNEFSNGKGDIFKWRQKLNAIEERGDYQPDVGELILVLTVPIGRLEERIPHFNVMEPLSDEEKQALDAVLVSNAEDSEDSQSSE